MSPLRLVPLLIASLSPIAISPLAFGQEEPAVSPPPVESRAQRFHTAIAPALRWTQEGSWQPPKGEWSLGLNELRWSPWDSVSLHMWTPPLALGGVNVGIRGSLYTSERWTIGAELRGLTVDFSRFQEEGAQGEAPRLLISPFSLYWSYLINPRLTLGLSFHHTAISIAAGAEGEAEIEGVAVSTNRHLRFNLGWAMSERWSLWWVANRMLYQGVGGSAISTLSLEGGGSLTVYGSGETEVVDPGQSAHRFVLSYRGDLISWSAGFATGVPPIYIIGTVAPRFKFLPYLDLSLRW